MARVDGLRMIESDSSARRRERKEWTADLLDLDAGRIGVPVLDREAIRGLLGASPKPRVAIVGASPSPVRPSHGVLVDLQALGYDVVPVNPSATEVAGLRSYPTVADAVAATGPVDIVDVFRLPPACPEHAREAVAVGAKVLWLQLGIASREAGRIAHEGGLAVVMNRCLAVEAARL
ncbi:MAG TPA: CoA-binding protein [Candidatus Limnocylindrales bacterium]|nr:CoA-binding protein [Candidatus Limnocylindrales bacterium]